MTATCVVKANTPDWQKEHVYPVPVPADAQGVEGIKDRKTLITAINSDGGYR